MRYRVRLLSAAAGFLGFAACSDTTGPPPADSVLATTEAGAIALTNRSSSRIFYFVYDREGAALINWAPCVDRQRCASLAPGDRVVIPNTTIGGYAPDSDEAIVWWWDSSLAGSAGEIHAIVVSLRR